MRPYFRFDSILIGAALVLWLLNSDRTTRVFRRDLSLFPSPLPWLALLAWTFLGEGLSRALYLTIQEVLAVAVLAHAVLLPDSAASGLLRWRPLRYTGGISYSLYLWQQLFLVTDSPSCGRLRELPLSLLVPTLIAVISYAWMEKPILNLKDRLAAQTV